MRVSYDAKSFKLDGRRIWIVGGEVHYFRHPQQEWPDVLLRAKRAGLNTIATYVPWNFHETTEGVFDFEGDKNLARYIDLIGEMGMYAMLRPGPYICSEWDGGGIPAWLCARPVRRFREDDPVYMAAVERWFDRLIPLIGERQYSRGGPVISVQNENEYPGGWDPSMRRYIDKLNGLFRRHGIDVPILACNVHGNDETTVKINDSTDERDQILDPGMVLTYNHHVVVEPVNDLKRKQPDAPLVITEFWSGAPVYWGNSVSDWPEHSSLARAAYEYASVGTQVVYYMFEGGTNFGFWGGNNIATSYASGYPVGEGGKLTDKYYAIRPANLFAGQFADLLADSEEVPDQGGIRCKQGTRLVVRRCASGSMAFLSAEDGRKEIAVTLPDGKPLAVSLGETGAAVIPVELDVFEGAKVEYSNLTLLAKSESTKTLILFGPAGTEGIIRLNGVETVIPVARRSATARRAGGVNIVVADEEMARRCWIVDGAVIFGPDYVGKRQDDGALTVAVSGATPGVLGLDEEGRLVRRSFRQLPDGSGEYVETREEARPPETGPWRMTPCAEPAFDRSEGWTPMDGPRSHEELGVVQGYVWYSAELESDSDKVETLLLPHAPNRVSVFVNGHYCGTHAERRSVRMRDEYAHPADWAFEELTVRLRKGINQFVFLSDDLGHNYDVPVPVGIQGPVYVGSRRLSVGQLREIAPQPVSADAHNFLYHRFYREPQPLPAVEFEVTLGQEQEAYITIHGIHAWITVDGEDVPPMSYPESPWTMFSQIKRWITWRLPERAPDRTRTVRIQYFGVPPQSVKEHMAVYAVPKTGECTNWHWKTWARPDHFTETTLVEDGTGDKDGIVVLLPVGSRLARKGTTLTPSWLETRFPMPAGDQPVYLHIGELQKGQIFLNGRNAGRFWRSGGTQEQYYLPRSWMREDNRLVIFEELGLHPQGAALVYGEGERRTGGSIRLLQE